MSYIGNRSSSQHYVNMITKITLKSILFQHNSYGGYMEACAKISQFAFQGEACAKLSWVCFLLFAFL